MTNYRITIHPDEKDMFKFCFTCGALLIQDGETLTCSRSWVDLRIFIEQDKDELECFGDELPIFE